MLAATRRRDARSPTSARPRPRLRATARGSARFVGGHPVCGSEARGAEHANAELFEGATWFLTPLAGDGSGAATGSSTASSSALGATPVAIDPDAHDRLVALTSHLPHALANLLVNQAGATRDRGTRAARRGRRVAARHDARRRREPAHLGRHLPRERGTRCASRSPSTGAASSSSRPRSPPATPASSRAGSARRRATGAGCSRRPIADPGELHQLRVHVPDRPGVLAGITQALGAERINIEDFELHHVSPERGGTLTLLVTGEGEAERAAALLEAQGYGVLVSPVLGPMKIEPAAALRGDIARPGRQVDLAPRRPARRDRRGRDARRAASAARRTPSRRSRPCAPSASTVHEDDVDALRVEGAGLRGLREPDAADRLRQRRHARCGCSPGILAGQQGRFELTGDDSLRGAADGADRRAARADGRARRDGRRHAAARDRGRRAARRSATSCRSRARR